MLWQDGGDDEIRETTSALLIGWFEKINLRWEEGPKE